MNYIEHIGKYFLMLSRVFRKPQRSKVFYQAFMKEVEDLGLKLDLSHNPLFDIMFEYYNFDVSEFTSENTALDHIEYANTSSKLDISFRVFEKENKHIFYLDYRTDLFTKETIRRFISYYKNILKVVAENVDIQLSEINMLPAEEYKLLAEDYNATALEYATDTNLVTVLKRKYNTIVSNTIFH